MSTTHTADAVTTEVSTGVTQSTFGKFYVVYSMLYFMQNWINWLILENT